jgi:hypothetical protein
VRMKQKIILAALLACIWRSGRLLSAADKSRIVAKWATGKLVPALENSY